MSNLPTAWPADQVERRSVASLVPYARNARLHSPAQVAQIAAAIVRFGWTIPVLVDEVDMILAGHGRILAAETLGIDEVPVIVARGWDEATKRAYVLADNKLAENAQWDEALLADELRALGELGVDLGQLGFGDDELAALAVDIAEAAAVAPRAGAMAEEFLVPPFSVLNARDGWWQDRKRQWIGLGIRSELGRGDHVDDQDHTADLRGGLTFGTTTDPYRARGSKFGKCLETGIGAAYGRAEVTGTSIFDPVLCELLYRWFSPRGGSVLDPFAGGSVRGIVAGALGRRYTGVDLRAEQVSANRAQAAEILDAEAGVAWIEGDSTKVVPELDSNFDFLFSCPPYGDLEVYSDHADDLSTMTHDDFLASYRAIIAAGVERLADDRFACFVVGDYRDKAGLYRDFVSSTIAAFHAAGAALYNEAVLVTAVGSLPLRTAKAFRAGRKLGKTHQNVLVFVKGDPRRAADACGPVEVDQALALAEAGAVEG